VVKGLQPGDPPTIGPYRLVGRLGSGGMGRVYLGVSAGGRPVAVKVVRAELAEDPDFRMRFGREVAAARRVSGLFTAMVVDADVDGPVAWLATAYVPGPSLFEAINDHGPLPASSLLTLAAGLAESLSAIHAAGVVHRDLKPSNVLLAEDGPRVIDFGISRAAESTALTQAGLVIGSPGFMSPEQAAGFEVGPPSDIFSLGAVLAFAATGEGPFGTGTTAALLYRVVHGSPSLDQVPTEVRRLIERCLAKDPSQRPTADGLLAEVGALQPTANWLPEPIVRAFARDAQAGPAPATAAAPAPAPGSLAVPGSVAALGSLAALGSVAESATQTTVPGAAAYAATGEGQLLAAAPASHSLTATSGSLPVPPGDKPPPGGGYPQLSPEERNRPRRRLWRPMVLVWIIVGMIAAGVAGFAVTSFVGGSTPTPTPSPAGLTSSAPGSTSGGRGGAPGVSGSASSSSSASRSASSSASAASSSSQGTSQPTSASASARASQSASPSHRAAPSPSPTSAPPTSKAPTPTPTPTPTTAPPTSAPPTSAPPTSAPPTSAPPTSAPPTSAPPTSAPAASTPASAGPSASAPAST
jgi:hypothetical protein